VDDVAQSGAAAATFSTSLTEHVADSSHVIKVTVSDGSLTASATSALTLKTDNTAPALTLSSSSYDVYSDETFTVTATATDAESDTLTYAWYLDDTLQTFTGTSTGIFFLATTAGYHTVKVTVSETYHSTSQTKEIYVRATGSLRLVNNETVSKLTQLYCVTAGSAWGSDYLTSDIAPGGSYILYGIDPGYYDAKVLDDFPTTYTQLSKYYYAGTPRTWTIGNVSDSFANRKGFSLGSTLTDGSEITAKAGTRDASVICVKASQR
jgi:hypothetical protein